MRFFFSGDKISILRHVLTKLCVYSLVFSSSEHSNILWSVCEEGFTRTGGPAVGMLIIIVCVPLYAYFKYNVMRNNSGSCYGVVKN